MLYNIITWSATPEIFSGLKVPNWYGLSWAFSFILGFILIKKIFKRDKAPANWADSILMYMIVAGILGARLGHCFFYDPQHYLANPIEILKIWEGGLASHGGAIGILIALFIFSKRVTKKNMLWVLDRVVICVAIAACFIRLGNLVNHEIVGHPSDKGMAMVFTRQFEDVGQSYVRQYFSDNELNYGHEPVQYAYNQLEKDSLYNNEVFCPLYEVEMNFGQMKKEDFSQITNMIKKYWKTDIDNQLLAFDHSNAKTKRTKDGFIFVTNAYLVPRHPAQLYESISYLLLFLLLAFMYWKRNAQEKQGLLFGTFLVGLFGARFFIEFIKVKQTGLTEDTFLNMGHYLSIPFVLIGLFFVIRALMKKDKQLKNE